MKKLLVILFSALLLVTSSISVFGETDDIVISSVTGEGTNVNVKGSVDTSVVKTAVAIQVVEKGQSLIISMQSAEIKDGEFAANIYANMTEGKEYTVKVANYDGGTFYTKDFVCKAVQQNPSTPSSSGTSSGNDSVNEVQQEVKTVVSKKTDTIIKVKEVEKNDFNPDNYKSVDEKTVVVSDNTALERNLDSVVDVLKDLKKAEDLPSYIEETESGAILAAIKAGKTFSINPSVEVVNDGEVIDDVAKIADGLASKNDGNKYQVEAYLVLDIELYAGNDKVADIKELDNPIEFAIALPEKDVEALKDKHLYVARIHDDEVELLDAKLEGNIVKFKSKKFSTFALVSSDKVAEAIEEIVEPISNDVQTSNLPLILTIAGCVVVASIVAIIIIKRNKQSY